MATVTSLGNQFNTTSGTHTVTATPAVGDYVVIISANTGYTGTIAPTDNNSGGAGTYTLVNSCVKASSADTMQVWIRTAPIATAASTVFTHAVGTTTGGGFIAFKVTGITLQGLPAVRQSAVQSNIASGTPTPVMGTAVLTGNPVMGAVFNATNPATMTPRTSYTESSDTGYATPTTGFEAIFRSSGETASSLAWGGTSASAFCSLVIELDTTSSITPTLGNLDQYDNTGTGAIASGGYTANGVSPGVNLEFDVVPYKETLQTDELDAKVESQLIGTNFTNTATQTSLSTYYDPNEPIGYRGSAFAYDTTRDRFIMTFGANGATSQNSVFELRFINGRAKWRQLATTGTAPAVRYQGGGCYDATNNRFIGVFGFTTDDTNELWAINFSSSAEGAWQQLTSFSGTAPVKRSNVTQTVVNDPTNNCFYVFGGWGASYYNGVYKFNYSTTSGAWSTLAADGAGGAPAARRNANAVLDSTNNRILVTGGNAGGATPENDLWAFALSGNTWSQLTPTGTAPTARERAWSYFDPVNRCMVYAMGDANNTAAPIQDMWKLDATTTNCAWSRIDRAQDSAGQMVTGMYLANAQWNPDMNVGVVWAGGVDITNDLQHHVLIVDSKDMGNSRVDLYGAVYNHFMRPMDATNTVYNPDASEAVAVGGFSQMTDNTTPANGGHVTDVFAYSATTNAWRVATEGYKTFPHREGMACCYDTIGQRIIAYGGLWGAGATNEGTFNDIWEIKRDINGNYLVRRMSPTGTLPGPRWLANGIFDANRNRFLLTCGSDGGATNYNDVWQLDLSGGGDGAWSQLTPTGTAPTAKWAAGIANDTVNNIAYIFGGCTSVLDGTMTNQNYKLDYNSAATAWTSLSTTSAPTARRSPGMALDPANGKIIVFGGYNGTTVLQDLDYYSVSGNTWTGAGTPATSPGARRSHGSYWDPVQNKMVITHGRTVSSAWWGDTWSLVPNYTTVASSTWTNLQPTHYIRASVNVPSPSGAYHWQAWLTDSTYTTDSAKSSYGGNAETAVDYTTAAGVNVDPSNSAYYVPNLTITVH